MRFERLYDVMTAIAKRDGYPSDNGTNRRDRMESIAHELAHAIDLGTDGDPLSGDTIEPAIEILGDLAADLHEVRVLRIEREAMRQLGVRYAMSSLSAFAQWRCGEPPTPKRFLAPLSRREQRCVRRFIVAVRSTHAESA